MALLKFFSDILNGSKQPSANARPAPSPAAQSVQQQPAGHSGPKPFLQREEVLDEKNRLAGYRFSCSTSDSGDNALFIAELVSSNVRKFAERRLTIIPLSIRAILRDEHAPLMAPNIIFQVDMQRSLEELDQLLEKFQQIRAAQAKVALSNFTSLDDLQRFAGKIDTLIFDTSQYSPLALEQLSDNIRHAMPDIRLLAGNVGSWNERRMFGAWGFKYIMGEVTTAKDEESTQKEDKLDQSRLVVFEMLNILKSGSHDEELAEAAKRDPGITFKLLAMANSPALGLKTPLTSITDAIKTLGRDAIYRWLTVSMFRVGKSKDRDESLMQIALVRGRFMETLPGQNLSKQARGELFLVGVLSVFEALLGLPMAKLMEMMQLSEPVRDVLLHNSGPYASHLGLALAVEKGLTEHIARLCEKMHIPQDAILATSLAAIEWADQAKS